MRILLIALLVLAAATANAPAQQAGGIEGSTGEALQMLRRARLAMQVGDAEQATRAPDPVVRHRLKPPGRASILDESVAERRAL